MNIHDIYLENQDLIENRMGDLRTELWNIFENDERYTLADDEIGELVDDLIIEYMKPTAELPKKEELPN